MEFAAEIREAIIRIAKSLIKKQQRRGKAKNIDTDKCTCDVDLGDGLMLYQVKLKARESGNDKGIVIIPKADSYVVAAMVEGTEADWQVIQYDEIDSAAFFFKNGGKCELKDNGEIHLNGSNFGELVKIQQLVDKINQLEQKLNELANWSNAHFHMNGNNGGATAVPFITTTVNINPQTSVNDLKNSKVKHGG